MKKQTKKTNSKKPETISITINISLGQITDADALVRNHLAEAINKAIKDGVIELH